MKLPYAEDVNYWQSGKSAPDKWVEMAMREIRGVGGSILGHAFGTDVKAARAAFMIQFILQGEPFKLVWPVLPSRSGNVNAAKIQAATFLYHDVKAKCMTAKILGAKAAFFSYLLLPDGRTAAEVSSPDLADLFPKLLTGGTSER